MHAGSQVQDEGGMGRGAEPQGPERINGTTQEFMGKRYWLCGRYFQRRGKRLHRVVWRVFNGPIPDGFHVHHIDGDASNNAPGNLECISLREHLGERHGEESAERVVQYLPKAREAARKWHASKEGIEWHRQHYHEHCADKMHRRELQECEQCGDTFSATHNSRFCSNKCKSAWRRDTGADHERRECVVCGKSFSANRYKQTKTCSRKCGATASARARTGMPQGKRCTEG